MQYQYYNQFSLSNELGDSISSIISRKEGNNYICKVVKVEIPEHEGMIYTSPLDGYNPWGGGLNALSGAEIIAINKKYGKYVERTIPKKTYSYFVTMDEKAFDEFSKLSFKSEEEIESSLEELSKIHFKYNGVFNSEILIQDFPYLKEFFDNLDDWRAENGRVSLDQDVLENSVKRILTNKHRKLRR